MKTKYKFIHFENEFGGYWACLNNRTKDKLGGVSFFGAWNEFVFQSNESIIYSAGCLNDIAHFLEQLNETVEK